MSRKANHRRNKYNFYMNGSEKIHVSNGNGKLGNGIYNISLLPGSHILTFADGTPITNIVGTCQGCCSECEAYCYARKFPIMYPNTLKAWGENTVLAREDMGRFFDLLKCYFGYNIISMFRIHVGGEFFSKEYMVRWMYFTKTHPDTKFYFYTKRYEWLNDLGAENLIPENVVPIVSPEGKGFSNPNKFFEFIVDDGTNEEIKKLPHCPAVNKNGHETGMVCAKCKLCLNGERGHKVACYKH